MSEFDCPACSERAAPVWATYPRASATIKGEHGHGTFRLPLHRCPEGHISGWQPTDDFLGDLALELDHTDTAGLTAGTVAPIVRRFRRTRCGNCHSKLEVRATGARLTGVVRAWIRTSPDPVEADLDVPAMGCAACGAQPDGMHRGVAETPADLWGWFWQLLAMAMPPERAVDFTPREGTA